MTDTNRENKTPKQPIEELKNLLNKIGWGIKGNYPNRYITDHEGKRTSFRVKDDGVSFSGADEHTAVEFYFKGSEIKMVDKDAVSIGTENCFALFMNHSIN